MARPGRHSLQQGKLLQGSSRRDDTTGGEEHTEFYAGRLAHGNVIKGWNDLVPGTAEKMIAAELARQTHEITEDKREAEHRRDIERDLVRDRRSRTRTQAFASCVAASLCAIVILGALYLAIFQQVVWPFGIVAVLFLTAFGVSLLTGKPVFTKLALKLGGESADLSTHDTASTGADQPSRKQLGRS